MIYVVIFRNKIDNHWLIMCKDGEPWRFDSEVKAYAVAQEHLSEDNSLFWDVMSLDVARDFVRKYQVLSPVGR